MTARQVYEYALIELNKKQAPSLLLEDYIYFINKVIQQFVNFFIVLKVIINKFVIASWI